MSLPEFNPYAMCPKCAFGEVQSRYIAVGTDWHVVFLGAEELRVGYAMRERIQRRCVRCNYRWAEAAIGTDQNEQPSLTPTEPGISHPETTPP